MENFFYDDEFYHDLSDLLDQLDIDENTVNDLEEDYALSCNESVLEPVVKLTPDFIMDCIDEERFPENLDGIHSKTYGIIENNIDFEKLNQNFTTLVESHSLLQNKK